MDRETRRIRKIEELKEINSDLETTRKFAQDISTDLDIALDEILSIERGLREQEFSQCARELTYLGLPLENVPKEPHARHEWLIEKILNLYSYNVEEFKKQVVDVRVAGRPQSRRYKEKVLPESAPVIVRVTGRNYKFKILKEKPKPGHEELALRVSTSYPKRLLPIVKNLREREKEIYNIEHQYTRIISVFDDHLGTRLVVQSKNQNGGKWVNRLFEPLPGARNLDDREDFE